MKKYSLVIISIFAYTQFALGQLSTKIDSLRLTFYQIDSVVMTIDTAVFLVETYKDAFVNSVLSSRVNARNKTMYDILTPLSISSLRPDNKMQLDKYVESLVLAAEQKLHEAENKMKSISAVDSLKSLFPSYKNVLHFAQLLFLDNNVRSGQNFEEGLWLAYHMYRIRHEEVKTSIELKKLNEAAEKKRAKSDSIIGKDVDIRRLFKRPKLLNDASKFLTKSEIETALTSQNYRASKRNLRRLIRQKKGTNFLGFKNFI